MSLFELRTETVRVYTGDYHDRLFDLTRRIEKAAASIDGVAVTLDETPEHVALVEEYNTLVAEAQAHRVDVKLQQLPRKVGKALRRAHPPRKAGVEGATERDERNDDLMGVNEDTFKEALVCGGTVKIDGKAVEFRTIIEPTDLEPTDLDNLSEGAFNQLYFKARTLNYGFVTDPKEISLDSPEIQTNSETSS